MDTGTGSKLGEALGQVDRSERLANRGHRMNIYTNGPPRVEFSEFMVTAVWARVCGWLQRTVLKLESPVGSSSGGPASLLCVSSRRLRFGARFLRPRGSGGVGRYGEQTDRTRRRARARSRERSLLPSRWIGFATQRLKSRLPPNVQASSCYSTPTYHESPYPANHSSGPRPALPKLSTSVSPVWRMMETKSSWSARARSSLLSSRLV